MIRRFACVAASVLFFSAPGRAQVEPAGARGAASAVAAETANRLESRAGGEESSERNLETELLPDPIIDKGAIARETAKRLRGYREIGLPQVPEGFLLRSAQADPKVSQVDLRALRARTIAIVEGRRAPAPVRTERTSPARPPAPATRSETSDEAAGAEDGSTTSLAIVLFVLAAGTAALSLVRRSASAKR